MCHPTHRRLRSKLHVWGDKATAEIAERLPVCNNQLARIVGFGDHKVMPWQ